MHRAYPNEQPAMNGLDLVQESRDLARSLAGRFPGHLLLPSGERIYYYTRLVLFRRGIEPAVEPTQALLPSSVVDAFLRVAPQVANWLRTEYRQAMQLLAEPEAVLPQLLEQAAAAMPRSVQVLGKGMESAQCPEGECVRLWTGAFQQLEQVQPSPLLRLLTPDQLLVAPIARPQDPKQVALRLLRARLVQDAAQRDWQVPPAGLYLYDEPLVEWLVRRIGELLHFLARYS